MYHLRQEVLDPGAALVGLATGAPEPAVVLVAAFVVDVGAAPVAPGGSGAIDVGLAAIIIGYFDARML